MYKQVKTEESAVGEGGWHPVATLKDEYGGVTHIVRDDGCYILINGGVDLPFRISAWIYPEAFEVLKKLPSPTRAAARKIAISSEEPYWHGDEQLGDMLISYNPPDPIFQTTKGWYFCDEVWADACGPFETREKATEASIDYANNELGDCPACAPKPEEWTAFPMPNEKCWTHSVFNCGECFNR